MKEATPFRKTPSDWWLCTFQWCHIHYLESWCFEMFQIVFLQGRAITSLLHIDIGEKRYDLHLISTVLLLWENSGLKTSKQNKIREKPGCRSLWGTSVEVTGFFYPNYNIQLMPYFNWIYREIKPLTPAAHWASRLGWWSRGRFKQTTGHD